MDSELFDIGVKNANEGLKYGKKILDFCRKNNFYSIS